jgi:hypothetical protein
VRCNLRARPGKSLPKGHSDRFPKSYVKTCCLTMTCTDSVAAGRANRTAHLDVAEAVESCAKEWGHTTPDLGLKASQPFERSALAACRTVAIHRRPSGPSERHVWRVRASAASRMGRPEAVELHRDRRVLSNAAAARARSEFESRHLARDCQSRAVQWQLLIPNHPLIAQGVALDWH